MRSFSRQKLARYAILPFVTALRRQMYTEQLSALSKREAEGDFRAVKDTLLISVPNAESGGGLFLMRDGRLLALENESCSGLCQDENRLLWSVQHVDHLKICELTGGSITQIVNTELCDIHDVRIFDGAIYTVSTSTNEIVILSMDGTIKERFKLPGCGDAWHANCLDRWGDRIVVSAFGQFEFYRGYKGKSDGKGIVFDLNSKEVIWSGLSSPHTPRLDRLGRKMICDSKTGRLLIDRGEKGLREIIFQGAFTRGIAFSEEYIYVGLSSLRRKANSHQAKTTIASAAVAVVDFVNLEHLHTVSLPVREIYDILVLSET